MSRNCVMCDKEIDLNRDAYISGESLGEYWCEECTKNEIKRLKIEIEVNKKREKWHIEGYFRDDTIPYQKGMDKI